MNKHLLKLCERGFSTINPTPKVCIVGAGPAGFYSAQHLVKNVPNIQIDILERLPVPFGLVRFGVAPDHPEVKNVINTFTKTAQNPNVRFIGNVDLGKDISLKQLQEAYNIVVLTYGADEDRTLNISGENLQNVLSARRIVGWYNGLPSDSNLKVDLSQSTAVIIGQGNVAIDVARILLTPIDILKKTDITEYSLDALASSRIKKVYLVGRRGPLQAAFTIKELREMLKLPNCQTKWTASDFTGVEEVLAKLARPRKRLTELMVTSLTKAGVGENEFVPKFFRSPLEFTGDGRVEGVKLGVNKLENESAVLTSEVEQLECGLAVRSIGYKSIQADKDLPFDPKSGTIPNKFGQVTPTLYSAGWLSTGPTGVILTTMSNSFETAGIVANQLKATVPPSKPGLDGIRQVLGNKAFVSWKGWERIDQLEQQRGKEKQKPREKIIDLKEMIDVGGGDIE